MFKLKPLHPDAVPKALLKAERYRLLNEPDEAESICLDVLAVDPDNQEALITLLLALTDQFQSDMAARCYSRAEQIVERLNSPYERAYYAGLIRERLGHAKLARGGPGDGVMAYGLLREAMDFYEEAEPLRPPHNDDAILRWNTCARIIMKHQLQPEPGESLEPAPLE
ncbi:MAG: hypothetical protein RMJ35_12745 [Phycisphaerales bacterium]|nr:hypothetical protein [Phycisphaerales bacterium]